MSSITDLDSSIPIGFIWTSAVLKQSTQASLGSQDRPLTSKELSAPSLTVENVAVLWPHSGTLIAFFITVENACDRVTKEKAARRQFHCRMLENNCGDTQAPGRKNAI